MMADDKYSLLNRDNLLQDLQIQLSQEEKKIFPNFFFFFFLHFGNLDYILNIFEKKMTLIADVFLNLRTAKNAVR